MRTIFAEYNPHRNSIDVYTSAGYMLRIDCCDANKIQRVFDNLLRNAVIYSYTDTEVAITTELQENTIVITFENFGNPIAEEKLKLIFEQFYRVDTSRNTTSGGAGLGLAIAKHIVELHKGTIVAHSKDECIKFIVTLPLS